MNQGFGVAEFGEAMSGLIRVRKVSLRGNGCVLVLRQV